MALTIALAFLLVIGLYAGSYFALVVTPFDPAPALTGAGASTPAFTSYGWLGPWASHHYRFEPDGGSSASPSRRIADVLYWPMLKLDRELRPSRWTQAIEFE